MENRKIGKNLVIVRDWANRARVCAVLDADAKVVMVCAPDTLADIRAGRRDPPLSGFPREDVFVAEPATLAGIASGEPIDWQHLRPY